MRLTADPHLRILDEGRVLAGGHPSALWHLSADESRWVARWIEGDAVGSDSGETAFARRVVDRCMFHPSALDPANLAELTVVIPVRDDADRLARTLRCLHLAKVVVVDDASAEPLELRELRSVFQTLDIDVIRRNEPVGPGRARHTAMAAVSTKIVAFVDAGVEVSAECLAAVAGRFADSDVHAAAPRVRSAEGLSRVERYDRRRSPIDMGPLSAPVVRAGRVEYLPTACLVVRVSSYEQVGGFDGDLRFGEDVDLVWRLAELGSVRYVADVEATHHPRTTIVGLARQRYRYGTGAAGLAARHGSAVAPVRTSPWSVAIVGGTLTGQYVVGASVFGYATWALRRRLSIPDRTREAWRMMRVGNGWAAVALGAASVRAWWPITLAALCTRRGRRAAASLVIFGVGRRLLDAPRGDRVNDVVVGLVDDVAAGAGVWSGAIRARSPRALLPDLHDPTDF